MTILARSLTLQELNACLLRIQRQMNDDSAALETKVTNIIDNSKTLIKENAYDDSALQNELNKIQTLINTLQSDIQTNTQNININKNDIDSLTAALANINVIYDDETNTLTYTDPDGASHEYELKDTTYTFEQEGNSLIITNDLDPTDTFTFTPGDTTYTFSFENGVLTITPSSGTAIQINFDARYYTEDEIQTLILDLIPAQASSSNQLADKNFVNSSIETATATFRGTYTTLADLEAATGDKNDYAFLKTLDSQSGLYTYDKYTYVEGTGWVYAYSLNTSGFTAAQLAAINSGITSSLVSKITDVYNCTVTFCQSGACVGSFTLNQNQDATINLTGGNLLRCPKSTDAECPLLFTNANTCTDINQVEVSGCCPLMYNACTGVLKTTTFATVRCSCSFSFPASSTTYVLIGCFQGSQCGNEQNIGFSVWGSGLVNNGVLKLLNTSASSLGNTNIDLKITDYRNCCFGVTGVGFTCGGSWNCWSCVVLKICNSSSAACSWSVGLYRNFVNCGTWCTKITCLGSTAPTFGCLIDVPTTCRNFVYNNGITCFPSLCGVRLQYNDSLLAPGGSTRYALLCFENLGADAIISVYNSSVLFLKQGGAANDAWCLGYLTTAGEPNPDISQRISKVNDYCVWFRYGGYRTPKFSSNMKMSVLCNTTTAPSGCTFTSPSYMACTACKVFADTYTANAARNILLTSQTSAACYTCAARPGISNSAPLTFNPSTGLFCTRCILGICQLLGPNCYNVWCTTKPQVCTTSAGWCFRHFYALWDVTCYVKGCTCDTRPATFTGRVIDTRYCGVQAESMTDVVVRMGYNYSNRVLNYNSVGGRDNIEPRILYKCDEDKYFLGFWTKCGWSGHTILFDGVFSYSSVTGFGSPVCTTRPETGCWICSCTPAGDFACACWHLCGTKVSPTITVNSGTAGCTYCMPLYCDNQLYYNCAVKSDGSTIYANSFDGYFAKNIVDVTSTTTYCTNWNVTELECAWYDRNINRYYAIARVKPACCGCAHSGSTGWYTKFTFPGCINKGTASYFILNSTNQAGTDENIGDYIAMANGVVNACTLYLSMYKGTSGSNYRLCVRVEVDGCMTNPPQPHQPISPDSTFNLWQAKDSCSMTLLASCCLYAVRLNVSNTNLGPTTGMLKIGTNVQDSGTATICFTQNGGVCKNLAVMSNPAMIGSTSCMIIQPYMFLEANDAPSYWFIFAVNTAYAGCTLNVDLLQFNTGLGSCVNNISCLKAWTSSEEVLDWNTYYVDTTSDLGSFTLSRMSTCHIQTNCMSTASARSKKKNIIPYNDSALNILRNTDVVEYQYKNEKDSDLPHIGFIADDTNELLAGANHDQMRINDTVGLLLAAVKELDGKMNKQKKTNIIKRIINKIKGE